MTLKQKLKNNQLTLGSWLTIGHQSVVEIMATGGFEWLTIDLEHSVIDLGLAQNLIGHIQANGMDALARVSKNEEVVIKRIMDAGATGVIVPTVKNKSEAQQAVDYVKYPPHGKRGVGLARAQKYGMGFDEYKKWIEEESVVIAQIEHIDAVENIHEIINTPGIDGTIIGPYDLSGSMGMPGDYDKPQVKEALETVKKACSEVGVPLGFHVIDSDYQKLQEKIDEGYTFLAFSLDFFFLGNKIREEMGKLASPNSNN